ncbi:urease accessory protein UreD [Thauera sp. 28]|uniref:urease accessory protein UreD n=1 Tax=unclassified Thauera TaxID=2609274 RepID=UPI0002CDBA5A|nr:MULTISPECIES: urease accessory protein UreD [unclassified Thauera]ENO91513.1 urease accessory protein UreD [Thauera sp. 28]WBL63893.1 urease accessory protein UreD [Thauera sp. WB-2]HNR62019.1 urease accessory protein UreD [Thauera sp.]HNS92651.1 urease accessory protein UreD [Thauera sp.]
MNAPALASALAIAPTPAGAGWQARLRLGFERRGARTVLVAREHCGPLVVQRPLYPEGEAVCHTILVHPPAGIAGGDRLALTLALGAGAHVLLTTPGAGKWYRSAGLHGELVQRIEIAEGGVCEFLPQESIVYDGALGAVTTEVELGGSAVFIGAEMLCLGRTGSGERFGRGELALRTRIRRDGRPVWLERGVLKGGGALLDSAVGLGGEPVSACLLIAAPACDAALLEAWRAVEPVAGQGAVTLLPGLLVARWLGPACEPGRQWLTRLWSVARPAVAGRAAQVPRIWRT